MTAATKKRKRRKPKAKRKGLPAHQTPDFIPDKAYIARMCRIIQDAWPAGERERRSAGMDVANRSVKQGKKPSWTPPKYSTTNWLLVETEDQPI